MIVFEGPPGAGKSLQARLLQDKANVVWLSVGKLLREKVTPELKEKQDRGELLDDGFVHKVLADAINAVDKNTKVLIDGYPRRQSQLDWFLSFIESHDRTLQRVIHLYIPREESMERLSKRGRDDDDAKTINFRYDLYEKETLPLLKQLGEAYSITEINGIGSVEEVNDRLVEALDGVINVHPS